MSLSRGCLTTGLTAVLLAGAPAFGQLAVESTATASLGSALEFDPDEEGTSSEAGPGFSASSAALPGAPVDPFDRADVADFYACEYLPSENYLAGMNWVGDTTSCTAGTVSSSFHDDTLRRVNYYRAMVGLNADIVFSAAKNASAQEGALIMSRNCGLSHTPIASQPGWACVTPTGDTAAGASNLSLSIGGENTGPDAVNGQMRDAGASNAPVGHRRWLLYPRAVEMGNGGIPYDNATNQCSAGVIWVIGDFGPRPASPEFVSWPNEGYVPYNLAWDRWSFSLFGANFDTASVSMTHDGATVPLSIVHPTVSSPAGGFGDPTIVWEPVGIPTTAPADEETYEITVSGITGTAVTSYTYSVTLIDPADPGIPLTLSGDTAPPIGAASTYSFPGSASSSGYTLRARGIDATPWQEGAEAGDPNLYIDGTDASYPLVTSAPPAQTGSQSFHLAFPNFTDQVLTLDRTIIPSTTSDLSFAYWRRFSSTSNTISAEISTDDGASWSALWSTTGVCSGSCGSGNWDPSWQGVTVPLAAYVDQPVRLRFIYRPIGGTFVGTGATSHGVTLDDISVNDAGTLGSEALTTVAAGETDVLWTPPAEQTYYLDLQAHMDCLDSTFGTPLVVTAVPEPGFALALGAGGLGLHLSARRRRATERASAGMR